MLMVKRMSSPPSSPPSGDLLQSACAQQLESLLLGWVSLPNTQCLLKDALNKIGELPEMFDGSCSLQMSPTSSSQCSLASLPSSLYSSSHLPKSPSRKRSPDLGRALDRSPGSPSDDPAGGSSNYLLLDTPRVSFFHAEPLPDGPAVTLPIPEDKPDNGEHTAANRSPNVAETKRDESNLLECETITAPDCVSEDGQSVVLHVPSTTGPYPRGSDREKIRKLFLENPAGLTSDIFREEVLQKILFLSKYFAETLFSELQEDDLVSEASLLRYWSERELEGFEDGEQLQLEALHLIDSAGPEDVHPRLAITSLLGSEARRRQFHRNFFNVMKSPEKDYITRQDLLPLLTEVMERHPGLDFLRSSVEFQNKYADSIVARLFYATDVQGKERIAFKDFCKGDVAGTWKFLDYEEDINRVRDYFSYEHFYVLYCKFFELDDNHDFSLNAEDLIKHDSHAFSRRAIDRIFSELLGPKAQYMGFEDFIYFLMSDEDKTTARSLEFWFRVVDLDGDGVIRDHEMAYFYEEQAQRLECFNHETVPFADILCQMCDMVNPRVEGQFELSDFKRNSKTAGVFFSILLSLNKFLLHESRDPFAQKQEASQRPLLTDWDRFCLTQYQALAEEAQEDLES